MTERGLKILSDRLARVEREHRRLRRLGAAAVVGLAAVVLLGQAAPDTVAQTIEAQQFVLRDPSGRIRAVLHVRADGLPQLDFRDAAGTLRVSLGVFGEMAALRLTDAKGKGGAILRTHQDNRPGLTFMDGTDTRRMTLFLSHNGSSTLAFSDSRRASRLVLNSIENGPMGLFFYDAGGRLRSLLDVEPDGSPALAFFDENRMSRAILGHTELAGRRNGTVERRQASSLLLFDKTGKVIWSAP